MEEALRELNAKAYAITLKEEEVLNQWLDEQLKAGLMVKYEIMICSILFLHSEEGWFITIGLGLWKAQSGHNKE